MGKKRENNCFMISNIILISAFVLMGVVILQNSETKITGKTILTDIKTSFNKTFFVYIGIISLSLLLVFLFYNLIKTISSINKEISYKGY